MRYKTAIALALTLACTSTTASAYTTKTSDGTACTTDGSACHVYCDSGTLAGTMYWNGSRWSDGVRSNEDKDVVASEIVQAQGSSCT